MHDSRVQADAVFFTVVVQIVLAPVLKIHSPVLKFLLFPHTPTAASSSVWQTLDDLPMLLFCLQKGKDMLQTWLLSASLNPHSLFFFFLLFHLPLMVFSLLQSVGQQ